MTVNAVILAGGQSSAEMQAITGVENRALTLLGSQTMLEYVVAALRQSPAVAEIFVVGDVPAGNGYKVVRGGDTLIENLFAGLKAATHENSAARVLIATSDIPFLTSESVTDFVQQGQTRGADLCCSYVSLARCLQQYPDMKRTAIKLREGRFTLGNLMLVNPASLLAHPEIIQNAYAARKSPAQVARLLGAGLLARLILAQTVSPALLPVSTLEGAVSRLLGGIRTAAILSEYPEIGTDVDKPEDVALAQRMLGARET